MSIMSKEKIANANEPEVSAEDQQKFEDAILFARDIIYMDGFSIIADYVNYKKLQEALLQAESIDNDDLKNKARQEIARIMDENSGRTPKRPDSVKAADSMRSKEALEIETLIADTSVSFQELYSMIKKIKGRQKKWDF